MLSCLLFNKSIIPLEIKRRRVYDVIAKKLKGEIKMKFGRTLAWYFYAYLIGGLVTWLCNLVFMRTLCCAILGEGWGLLVAELLRYFLWPLVAFWVIYTAKRKDVAMKQEYLRQKEGKHYCFRIDVIEILRDSVFWKEFVIVCLLSLLYALFYPLLPIISIPMFLLLNFFTSAHLHCTWLQGRIRI